MKTIIYGICIIFYLTGLLVLVNFLFKFQSITFKNAYYSSLYPFLGLFLFGFYISLFKLFKKVDEPNIKFKIGKVNKMLYLIVGIIILLLLLIKINFNSYDLTVFLAFIGYGISLASGYQMIIVKKIETNNN